MKDRIKLIMEDQHLTQQSFAQMLGISPAQLSSIFNDRTKPTLNIVDAIKKKLPQVNLEWLLYGTPPMYMNKEEGGAMGNAEAPDGSNPSSAIDGLALNFEDAPSSSTPQASEGSLFDAPLGHGVKTTPKNTASSNVKYIDKPQRKITEIRIFYDDQTWETFVPKQR